MHAFTVGGLAERAVAEGEDRMSAAIKNSGYASPKQKNQKVVISLAPADIRKEGPSFDLAMAISYLSASGEITFDPSGVLFLGELSLEGYVRKINGLLPILCQAKSHGFHSVFISKENYSEASLARDLNIFAVSNLNETLAHIDGEQFAEMVIPKSTLNLPDKTSGMDMRTIRGNETAKRGLEIAAAGAHNLLMYGPPGTGKTMLAQGLLSILPSLSYEQSIEVTGIHSAAHILNEDFITYPPFRAPHHTASYPSIVGGGSFPKPGEITLAHRGVLFLDEFPEFDRKVLEALRQPLEERVITISRSKGSVSFPAQCILIASMNPCPCGRGGEKGCTCSTKALEAYKRRISGPIMDRIDIWLPVNKIDYEKLAAKGSSGESSENIRHRIVQARDRQVSRFRKYGIGKSYNSEMNAEDIDKCVKISDEARAILTDSAKKLGLSGRAFHRVIKVTQTICDLKGSEEIDKTSILEAFQYRQRSEF